MNPAFFGDSFDLVKRFFVQELSTLGYRVVADLMLTGEWGGNEREFYRLVGVEPHTSLPESSTQTALFLDPDTGISRKDGPRHVSFGRIAQEAQRHALIFSFDQSFSRQAKPEAIMREKLMALEALGCYGMYYNSHARFLFASAQRQRLHELRMHLLSLGLPAFRLLETGI
jgi:hypothetical protein